MMNTQEKFTPDIPFVISLTDSEENPKNLIFYFKSYGHYDIYLDNEKIGDITNSYDNISVIDKYKDDIDTIKMYFKKYIEEKVRDKNIIKIGYPVHVDENPKIAYLSLLMQGCVMMAIKTKKGIEYAKHQYEQIEMWLQYGDFFTAPASTRFHDDVETGLLCHTLKVYNFMCDLKNTTTFRNVDAGEMTICALVHDWCKINVYGTYKKNVKDEDTGAWFQTDAYTYKGSQFPFGHGETSMYLAEKFFHNLSLEGALSIRWHMDKFYTSDALNDDLLQAKVKYPLVIMLQTADKLSLVEY